MKTEHVGRWLNIGAYLTVLIGLVLVAIELRHIHHKASAAQAADAIADGFLQLNIVIMTDPAVARNWTVGLHEPAELSDLQAIQFSMHMRGLFNQFQRVHRLYRNDFLSEEDWALFAREAAWLMSTEGGRLHFEGNELPSDFKEDIAPYFGQEPNIDLRLGRKSWPLD